MADAPCRTCEERTLTCHDSCSRFRKFREPFERAQEERIQKLIADSVRADSQGKACRKRHNGKGVSQR